MAGLFVEEYGSLHFQEGVVFPIPATLIVVREITIAAGSDEIAAALNAATEFVNLTAEGACHWRFGVFGATTAVTSDRFLPTGASRFFKVNRGNETTVACLAP